MDQQSTRRAAGAARRECEPNAIYAPHGLAEGISVLAAEPIFAAILGTAGSPRFRRRRNGFGTLLHIILEQQVSIDAAAAMHRRLVGLCRPLAPETFLDLVRPARADDEAAMAQLLSIKGIGRWSAEVYLLFALGRPDVWPAADLGLQLGIAEQLGLGSRPTEQELRQRGAEW